MASKFHEFLRASTISSSINEIFGNFAFCVYFWGSLFFMFGCMGFQFLGVCFATFWLSFLLLLGGLFWYFLGLVFVTFWVSLLLFGGLFLEVFLLIVGALFANF